jgi:hypothetical protein
VSDVVLTPKDGNVSVSSAALAMGAQPSTVYTSEPRPPAAPPSAPPDVRLQCAHWMSLTCPCLPPLDDRC